MGTRGKWGVVVDGVEKIQYVHWDSYPDGLGLDVLRWLRGSSPSAASFANVDQTPGEPTPLEVLAGKARALRVVDPESTATPEDVERLQRYADTNVGSRELDDWYVLLRETQGKPELVFEAGVVADGRNYSGAEYEYVVDFDAGTFAAFDGARRGKPVASWPLTGLPTDEAFVTAFGGDDE